MQVLGIINRRLHLLAGKLITMASLANDSFLNKTLRRVLCLNPMMHALILYLGGFIRDAKAITDKKQFKNKVMLRVTSRIDSISLALSDWDKFQKQVSIPRNADLRQAKFNNEVLMVVNSCSGFDKNGYAVRSVQISKALRGQSIGVSFCARLGYPWDIPGRENLPKDTVSSCEEGQVSLQHDPDWQVGEVDIDYWHAYASHIKSVVSNLKTVPGVIHAHSKYSNAIASIIAGREMGIPVVYEMRGLWHMTRAQREPTFNQTDFYRYEENLEVWSAELADGVVVISDSLKAWLVKKGIDEKKIRVIPNAIDPADWNETEEAARNLPQSIKLAFMGSLTSYEGLDTVLQSMKILKSSGQAVTLDVFGDGKYRRVLESLTVKLGLKKEATFHGRVEPSIIKKQVAQFDIFPIIRKDSDLTRLIPPLKHLEPMLAERVVLISNLRALLDNVPKAVADLAVPADDPDALAIAIKELAVQPERRKQIGQKSRDWVIEQRNWKENTFQYVDLYTSVSKGG